MFGDKIKNRYFFEKWLGPKQCLEGHIKFRISYICKLVSTITSPGRKYLAARLCKTSFVHVSALNIQKRKSRSESFGNVFQGILWQKPFIR